MLVIRFSPRGKSKFITFKIVLQEKQKTPKGKNIETLGNYNPHTKEFSVEKERITYWLGQGAKTSPTVHNLLIQKKIIKGKKVKAWIPKKKKNKKEETAEKAKPEKEEEKKESKQEKKTKEAKKK